MRIFFFIIVILSNVISFAQMRVDTTYILSKGFEPWFDFVGSPGFKDQKVTLFVRPDQCMLDSWHWRDSLGNEILLSSEGYNTSFSSLGICLMDLDSHYYTFNFEQDEDLEMENEFCLIEKALDFTKLRTRVYRFYSNATFTVLEMRNAAHRDGLFKMYSRLDSSEEIIRGELDIDGNGIQKIYDKSGQLLRVHLFKEGFVVDTKYYGHD